MHPAPPHPLVLIFISFQKPILSVTTVVKDSSGDVNYHEQVTGSTSVTCNQGQIYPPLPLGTFGFSSHSRVLTRKGSI